MMIECNNDGTIALGLIPGTGVQQGGNKSCLTVTNELSATVTVTFTAKVMLQISPLLCWADATVQISVTFIAKVMFKKIPVTAMV